MKDILYWIALTSLAFLAIMEKDKFRNTRKKLHIYTVVTIKNFKRATTYTYDLQK